MFWWLKAIYIVRDIKNEQYKITVFSEPGIDTSIRSWASDRELSCATYLVYYQVITLYVLEESWIYCTQNDTSKLTSNFLCVKSTI